MLDCHVQELRGLGASHVSLNPFGWVQSLNSPEIHLSTHKGDQATGRWWGESDAGLLQYASAAKSAGQGVMLRPHLWVRDNSHPKTGEAAWLDSLDFDSEGEWLKFAESYRAFALHYARVAQQGEMEWYSIGAELTQLTKKHPEYWRGLIRDVRAEYSGKLIYSANWYNEVEQIVFWDDLDAIGVQAYFPLASVDSATTEQLQLGWEPHLKMLQGVSEKYGKPVIFTEIGYKSTTCTAKSPWDWKGTGGRDDEYQARVYAATLEALKDRPWFSGMYWWKYHVQPCEAVELEGIPRRQEASFAFQGKPAQKVLQSRWLKN
ncbi:MAG: hypothetical protein SFY68_05760 [Candidatus Sumerlaeia bacterium]|nr:hypothetical protein [Candidatus Sumerlaeia bacterium]